MATDEFIFYIVIAISFIALVWAFILALKIKKYLDKQAKELNKCRK